jgi:hypothetical protein
MAYSDRRAVAVIHRRENASPMADYFLTLELQRDTYSEYWQRRSNVVVATDFLTED